MHAIIWPCRSSMLCTNVDACSNDSNVPVSSQAMPRPSTSTCRSPRSRYARFTSVISSSPRADGVSAAAISTTWLS